MAISHYLKQDKNIIIKYIPVIIEENNRALDSIFFIMQTPIYRQR